MSEQIRYEDGSWSREYADDDMTAREQAADVDVAAREAMREEAS